MRILIFTFGTRGDVQPYVALGQALNARGHEVTLSTGLGFEAMIAEYGLTAAPVSIDFRELVHRPEMQEALRSFSGKLKAWRSFRGQFRRQFDDMWTIARDVRPDLLIAHPKGFVASSIARALEIIAIPTTLQPAFVPTGAFANFLLPVSGLGRAGNRLSHLAFNRLASWGQGKAMGDWQQTGLGLDKDGSKTGFFEGYHPEGKTVPRLHGYSRHIVPKPDDWGLRDHLTGYWFLKQPADWTPPAELQRFLAAGPPPVYIGFGSMPVKDPDRLTGVVVEAVRLSGQRAVLVRGWGGLSGSDAPDGIHVLDAAPHDWLFPRCSAVVHHGGAGTTHEGLRWGRPTIVCPFGVDQPFWGGRVHGLGAGPAPLPQKRLTAGALAAAIADALDERTVARAAGIGKAMAEEGGASAAADVVESVHR